MICRDCHGKPQFKRVSSHKKTQVLKRTGNGRNEYWKVHSDNVDWLVASRKVEKRELTSSTTDSKIPLKEVVKRWFGNFLQ